MEIKHDSTNGKKNKDGVKWNVDYARMDIDGWNMDHINAFLAKK